METAFKNLMTPITVGPLTLKNRYAVGPLGSGAFLAGPKGEYSNNAIEYVVERARGGFGLITMGAVVTDTQVDKVNPMKESMLAPLFSPKTFHRAAYTLTDRVHVYGTKIFVQLTLGHGRIRGEKAPSALPLYYTPENYTEELTPREIEEKIAAEVRVAPFMKDCGFDGIEVHAMHWGYLLDQFAMSITNRRADEYGGNLEQRLSVARKVVEGIKGACGSDYPVSIRLGLKSYMKGFNQASLFGEEEVGRTLEEGVKIATLLESFGYDMLSVNSGVYDSFYYCAPPVYMPKGYNIRLAREAKKAVGIPIFTAGRMDDPDMCEQAVANGDTDGIVLARPTLVEPHYAKKVEMGIPEKIRPCISCENCIQTLFSVGAPICAVNPGAMRDDNYYLERVLVSKNIAVIGGGVAGMEAARVACLRGHKVTLYEKGGALGGHLLEGAVHAFKSDIKSLNRWYNRELHELGVPVHYNTAVTADDIKSMGVDAAILAVGSVPVMPETIKGIDRPIALSCIEALLQEEKIGKNVVVVGGGLVGAEMAYDYAQKGKTVTLVETLDEILSAGAPIPSPVRDMLIDLLHHFKVNIMTGSRLEEICDTSAVVIDKDGLAHELAADNVILSIGFRPAASMADDLLGTGIAVYQIGDGRKVGNIQTAISDAYEVARKL